jgi:hypothetical protein
MIPAIPDISSDLAPFQQAGALNLIECAQAHFVVPDPRSGPAAAH